MQLDFCHGNARMPSLDLWQVHDSVQWCMLGKTTLIPQMKNYVSMLPETFARESWQDQILLLGCLNEKDDVLLNTWQTVALKNILLLRKRNNNIYHFLKRERNSEINQVFTDSFIFTYIFLQHFQSNIKIKLIKMNM